MLIFKLTPGFCGEEPMNNNQIVVFLLYEDCEQTESLLSIPDLLKFFCFNTCVVMEGNTELALIYLATGTTLPK